MRGLLKNWRVRYLRLPLRWKYLLTLLTAMLLPAVLLAVFFLVTQYREIRERIYEAYLQKLELVGAELENEIKNRAWPGPDNPLLVDSGVLSPGDKAPYQEELGAENSTDFWAAFEAGEGGYQTLFRVFRDRRKKPERVLIYYALWQGGQADYFVFDGKFLEKSILRLAHVKPDERIYLFTLKRRPVLSGQIEEEFQVPRDVLSTVFPAGRGPGPTRLRAGRFGDEDFLFAIQKLPRLPLTGVLAVPRRAALAPLFQAIYRQLILLGLIATGLVYASFFVSRRQLSFLSMLGDFMRALARRDFSVKPTVATLDERRAIVHQLERVRRTLARYQKLNIERLIREEAKLQTVIGSIQEAILVTDDDFQPLLTNSQFEFYFQAEGAWLSGRNVAEALAALLRDFGYREIHGSGQLETVLPVGPGMKIWFSLSFYPLEAGETLSGGWIFSFRDITRSRASFEKELEYAAGLQKRFLPAGKLEIPGLNYSVEYLPFISVGGDYYDFWQQPDGRFVFILADVTGHGLQAAMMMVLIRMLIRQVWTYNQDLVAIRRELGEAIERQLPGMNLLPLLALVLEPEGTEANLDIINLGHPGPYLATNPRPGQRDDWELIERTNKILGIFHEPDTNIVRRRLGPGARIFMATDGVTDVENYENEQFGEEGLEDFLVENGDLPPEEFSLKLKSALRLFSQGKSFTDDVTWFSFQWEGEPVEADRAKEE